MSALETQPSNLNFLGQNGFKFAVKKLPGVNYFCQAVTIPAVSMTAIQSPTPFASVPRPGDRITYDPLTVTFKVDEDLKNYFEIQKWLEGLGHPDSLDQTRQLSRTNNANFLAKTRPEGYYTTFVSDGVLSILTSAKNLNKNIMFLDLFPTGLSELNFETTNSTIEYLQATATFAYRKYELEE